MSFTGLLNNSMSVRSVAVTADAYGGQSVSYSTVYSLRPCRINVLTDEQQAYLMRLGLSGTHKFYCDADMTITPAYELISGGVVYPVVSVKDVDLIGHHLEILTTRLA